MSRRVKFIIAIVLVIILGILFALGLRGARKGGTGVRSTAVQETTGAAAITTPESAVIAPIDEKQRAELTVELSIETLARSFAERFGSYSNQNQFENIKDLYPFMTNSLREKSAREIKQAQSAAPVSPTTQYSGVTTKAMSVEFEERTESRATVKVQTQRKEFLAAQTSPKIYYQEIVLTLLKDGGQWKVDSAQWN